VLLVAVEGVFDLEAGAEAGVGVELEVVGAVEDLTFEPSELDDWAEKGVLDCTTTFDDWEDADETGTEKADEPESKRHQKLN
jgi:hypothetical protein